MFWLVDFPARLAVDLLELIESEALTSSVMNTPKPAGLVFSTEASPPNAPIEPAIALYLAVPREDILS